jgi:hypothetical protein
MIDPIRLRDELQDLVVRLEDDLREHLAEDPATDQRLRAEHAAAREAHRTAQAYEPSWRDGELTQAAVAYVLGCVFIRFLEDNDLIAAPWLAGPVGPRLDAARDRRTAWFQQHPRDTSLGYLRAAFSDVAKLPAMQPLFDERHNASWSVALGPDGAAMLHEFWQRRDEAGALVHDFTDAGRSTRFLGELYQELSAAARDRYALFQTPEFVEEFILDRTLEPAIVEFGLAKVTLLDPTCGSGHFLLGAFGRLLRKWELAEPGTKTEVLVQRALDAVAGADLNPYAIAIARFRLLVAAVHGTGGRRLADARNYKIHLAVADSLLHGNSWGARRLVGGQLSIGGEGRLDHLYRGEDAEAIADVLGHPYHIVVGNPPYVIVKDPTLNTEYRRYGSCRGKYSLAVPFTERFFDLALPAEDSAGYVGMITTNSFMKREFGKTLIEKFLPRWDLTHVIDTSDAPIPNHDTPTVILFGRHRQPLLGSRLRMVLGIRGELPPPTDPTKGKVWSEIVGLVDRPGETGEFVSASDVERERLAKHPWPTGGGGAAELKELLDEAGEKVLGDIATSIGITSFTLEDDIYLLPKASSQRLRLSDDDVRPMVAGDAVRDWQMGSIDVAAFPYDAQFEPIADSENSPLLRYLWRGRTCLTNNRMFGGVTKVQSGLRWFEYGRLTVDKLRVPRSLVFGEVATHNHFVLDRGGKVFKQTAPVIKLPVDGSEDDHLGLLGLLNSSVGGFWLRQVCQCKGIRGQAGGTTAERWEQFYQFNGTKLLRFPVVDSHPLELARQIDTVAQRLTELHPERSVTDATPTRGFLDRARDAAHALRQRMIFLQEELDWWCYRGYNLLAEDLTVPSDGNPPPDIGLGERAFEIVMAREMAAGRLTTNWFDRHGSTPVTEIPADWPPAYRAVVEHRLEAIATNPNIHLIEQPEYKRRWNNEPWPDQEARALRDWLLTRMEDRRYWFAADGRPQITSCAHLADLLRRDQDFLSVATLYRGRDDFHLVALVIELAESDAVPFLVAYRYTPEGRGNRTVWERTWDLQRQEDAIDARTRLLNDDPQYLSVEKATAEKARIVGNIPVPDKYDSGDFAKPTYWRLRGKLDVPKERFILYPGAEREVDTSPVLGWAGWEHLEQARALAEFTVTVRENEAWAAERIAPLLAGLDELVPWLKQWHNDRDPATGQRLGDYFEAFVAEEARSLGITLDALRALEPPRHTRGRRPQKKKTAKRSSTETE